MTTTTLPLRLGSLELLHDRVVQASSTRSGCAVETLHLDRVHRTAVRFGHRPAFALLSLVLAVESVFGVDLGHLNDSGERLGLGLAALVLIVLYVATRTVQLSVSGGAHTLTVQLRGGRATATKATQFALRVDNAALQARRPGTGYFVPTGPAPRL